MPDLVEQMYCAEQIHIPPTFPYILKQYAKAAIRTQPYDLLRWSAAYFRAMANGDVPPVKVRLEYPPSDFPEVTPGYLRVLLNQFKGLNTVPAALLFEKWLGICLNENALREMLKLGKFGDEVDFPKFVAIAAGHLTESLTKTMIMLCELLTEEPEGGSAMIPCETFCDLYTFLARMNCGPPSAELGEEEESLLEEEMPVKYIQGERIDEAVDEEEEISVMPEPEEEASQVEQAEEEEEVEQEEQELVPTGEEEGKWQEDQTEEQRNEGSDLSSVADEQARDEQSEWLAVDDQEQDQGQEEMEEEEPAEVPDATEVAEEEEPVAKEEESAAEFAMDEQGSEATNEVVMDSEVGGAATESKTSSSMVMRQTKKRVKLEIKGIGGIVPEERIEAVIKYMSYWAIRQEDMIMPRNIHHFLCPPLNPDETLTLGEKEMESEYRGEEVDEEGTVEEEFEEERKQRIQEEVPEEELVEEEKVEAEEKVPWDIMSQTKEQEEDQQEWKMWQVKGEQSELEISERQVDEQTEKFEDGQTEDLGEEQTEDLEDDQTEGLENNQTEGHGEEEQREGFMEDEQPDGLVTESQTELKLDASQDKKEVEEEG